MQNDVKAKRIAQLLEAFADVPEPSRADRLEAVLYRACRGKGVTTRSTIDFVIAQLCLRDGQALLAKDRDFEAIAENTRLQLVKLP